MAGGLLHSPYQPFNPVNYQRHQPVNFSTPSTYQLFNLSLSLPHG